MHAASDKGLSGNSCERWVENSKLYSCELELQRCACFVSGCANSGGVKEVQSFLPTILGMPRQDTGERGDRAKQHFLLRAADSTSETGKVARIEDEVR